MERFSLMQSANNAAEIETQIVRLGIALGINWDDDAQVRALAHEALFHSKEAIEQFKLHPTDYQLKARTDLFGLAGMMMQIMKESAEDNVHTHGGTAWKSFSRALMHEWGSGTQEK
jgi:hypothetical protein